jgi:hypothetical protein
MNKYILAGLITLVSGVAFGQSGYTYQRAVEGVQNTWHRLELPDAMYARIKPGLPDVRLLGINQADTIEVPYILVSGAPKQEVAEVPFQVINPSFTSLARYYTFALTETTPIDRIWLDVKNTNFDWKVRLEGSHNQTDWFTLLEDYRLVDIHTAETQYTFTELRFPPATYAYFRLMIPDKEAELREAGLRKTIQSTGVFRHHALTPEVEVDKTKKETTITIPLPTRLPVSAIKIQPSNGVDYFRPFQVYALRDSSETQKGWRRNYQRIGRYTLSSLDTTWVNIPESLTGMLKVVIENQDNRPLVIESVELKTTVYSCLARFDEPQAYAYYLVYGKATADRPSYDIARFAEKLSDSLPSLRLGEEERIVQEDSPSFVIDPRLLWAAILLVAVALGWFAFKMLSEKK